MRTHTRKCADKNACGTIEGKPKTSETENRGCGNALIGNTNNDNDGTGTCTENWSCGEFGNWSACLGGTQSRTRTCADAYSCTTTASRPALSESRSCADTAVSACTESWSCIGWAAGSWGVCQESGTQTRTLTRTCTDAGNCGTTTSRPATSQGESQACDYTPTEQKPEYTTHSSTLGSNISELSYSAGSVQFNTAGTGGQYGYRILNIPSHATVKICVQLSSGGLGYNAYPQYHYGYDWSTEVWELANPGCMTAYNKNNWANGILLHIGDPTPATASGNVTITQIS